MKLARYDSASNELPLMSNFDISSDKETLSSGSWENALISELEHLRVSEAKTYQNNKALEVHHDMYSMEKRAIVSVDTPKGGRYLSDVTRREIVSVEQDCGLGKRNKKPFDYLQIVLNAMLEEKHILKRSLDELFDDMKIALECINQSTACKSDITQKSTHPGESDSFHVKGFSGFIEAIHRIIKLIEGIAPNSFICNNDPDCLEEKQNLDVSSQSPKSKYYFVHVLRKGELISKTLSRKLHLLWNGALTIVLTPQMLQIARDKLKKHLNSFLSVNENQNDVDDKQSFRTPSVAYPADRSDESSQYDFVEENRKLKDDLANTKSAKKDL
ncbi:unnamed protein product [Vicia faba]|uniref:Uncharacterized protein n=1 Tax=Vicia faba TaxID=3906 RepID=A0AAV1AKZ5_VICFA|nr:unnamed protein product [Vicia faba]